jgi:hypothetical protein
MSPPSQSEAAAASRAVSASVSLIAALSAIKSVPKTHVKVARENGTFPNKKACVSKMGSSLSRTYEASSKTAVPFCHSGSYAKLRLSKELAEKRNLPESRNRSSCPLRTSNKPMTRLIATILWATSLLSALASEPNDLAWVEQHVRELQPTAREKRFDEIGWAADLRDAKRLAQTHSRPVFLFTHDGRMNIGRC